MVLKLKQAWLLWGLIIFLLSACSTLPVEPPATYSSDARKHLYQFDRWSFDGRLAIKGQNDSWSANLNWKHNLDQESIKLSGPLGQGATLIQLSDDFVSVDRGNGRVESSGQPEEFVNQQLGVFVPLKSLRFWVLGLPEPTQPFAKTIDGFTQSGWLIEYKEMQATLNQSMPRKIFVTNSHVKLKLIIDQWAFNHAAN